MSAPFAARLVLETLLLEVKMSSKFLFYFIFMLNLYSDCSTCVLFRETQFLPTINPGITAGRQRTKSFQGKINSVSRGRGHLQRRITVKHTPSVSCRCYMFRWARRIINRWESALCRQVFSMVGRNYLVPK